MRVNERIVTIKNEQKLVLRSPESKDTEAVLNYLRKVTEESFMNLNHPVGTYDDLTIEQEQKILKDYMDSNLKFMIIALHEDQIVGHLGFTALGNAYTKYSARLGMTVIENYQRRGVGNALLKYCLKSAKEFHFHRIELLVRAHNYPAISLYEKHGFELVGTLKEHVFIDDKYYDDYLYEIIL